MAEIKTAIENIVSEMEQQLSWDEMEAAAMDEAGRIQEMEIYDKAASVRRDDIRLVRSLLELPEVKNFTKMLQHIKDTMEREQHVSGHFEEHSKSELARMHREKAALCQEFLQYAELELNVTV